MTFLILIKITTLLLKQLNNFFLIQFVLVVPDKNRGLLWTKPVVRKHCFKITYMLLRYSNQSASLVYEF